MAKKIYMTSLKGGTGVTVCAVNFGFALAALGERTLIADGDGVSSCALAAGGCAGLQVYTLGDYERGACRAKQTLVGHPKEFNLFFMSSAALSDRTYAGRAIGEVDGLFDYILCDKLAPEACDSALIVTEPYPAAVKSADFCRSSLFDGGMREVGLVVNKLNGGLVLDGSVMTAQEIAALLDLPLAAVIPEDLTLCCGRGKKQTARAFALAAECLTGRKNAVSNVTRAYFGASGYIRRKLRRIV